MKTIEITISGTNIHYEAIGVTLLEWYRVVHGLHYNLTGLVAPANLELNNKGEMIVVVNEKPPVRIGGEPATIKMQVENGFPCDGDIQFNGESKDHVISCLEYLVHLAAKRLVQIAEDLIGDDKEMQAKWIERIINKNIL
jgi:hypothetical protein